MNYMGNNQIKKRAAERHNKLRREAQVEAVRIAQDKIDNPEKYNRRNRRTMAKVMPFIAMAEAAGISI